MKEAISIFSLAIVIFYFSCSPKLVQQKCKNFKTGRFQIRPSNIFVQSIIERNDSIQTETDPKTGHIVKAHISWNSDCEYELQYFEQTKNISDTIGSYIQSKPLRNEIIAVGSNYYVFRSTMEGINTMYVDTMWLVK